MSTSLRLRALISPRSSSNKAAGRRGFTLVELLVVISIIGILSALVFANYRRYDSEVILQNKAYQVALAIREAQIRSISIGPGGGSFQNDHGVRFNRTSGNNTSYSACVYTGTANNPVCTATPIGHNIVISDVRTKNIGSTYAAASYAQRNFVDLKFVRPHLTGEISYNGAAFSVPALQNLEEIRVTLTSPNGSTRTIRASRTGMIVVE